MSDLVIYTRADGGLSIMYPVNDTPPEALLKTVPQDAQAARVIDSAPVDALNASIASNMFRNAWRDLPSGIGVDLDIARELFRATVRRVRNIRLDELDKAELIATSKGDATALADVREKKTALRDVTATLNAIGAANADDLLERWPGYILGPPPVAFLA